MQTLQVYPPAEAVYSKTCSECSKTNHFRGVYRLTGETDKTGGRPIQILESSNTRK